MLDPSISYPHHYRRQPSVDDDDVAANEIQQSRPELRSVNVVTMTSCYSPYELSAQRTIQVPVQKDYSKPLHVDCSVEYELPNTAKPPQGVRNEPLLMIHPCYFRKIESQRRSPFVNNLPVRTTSVANPVKRGGRIPRGQQLPQQVPHQGAQYPVQYASAATERHQLWDSLPPLVPITSAASQTCCSKRDPLGASTCGSYSNNNNNSSNNNNNSSASLCDTSSIHWTDLERSPDRPEDKQQHILAGKYRQYLRSHRLHPYVTSAIPLASTFPQMQQVCYNV